MGRLVISEHRVAVFIQYSGPVLIKRVSRLWPEAGLGIPLKLNPELSNAKRGFRLEAEIYTFKMCAHSTQLWVWLPRNGQQWLNRADKQPNPRAFISFSAWGEEAVTPILLHILWVLTPDTKGFFGKTSNDSRGCLLPSNFTSGQQETMITQGKREVKDEQQATRTPNPRLRNFWRSLEKPHLGWWSCSWLTDENA